MRYSWKRILMALTGGFALLIAPAVLVAQPDPYEPPEPGEDDSIIESFAVDKTDGQQVTLTWSIEPDDRDEEITCSIDVDQDNVIEGTLPDCDDDRTFEHSYDEPGRYTAVIVARSRDGGADRATTTVVVTQ